MRRNDFCAGHPHSSSVGTLTSFCGFRGVLVLTQQLARSGFGVINLLIFSDLIRQASEPIQSQIFQGWIGTHLCAKLVATTTLAGESTCATHVKKTGSNSLVVAKRASCPLSATLAPPARKHSGNPGSLRETTLSMQAPSKRSAQACGMSAQRLEKCLTRLDSREPFRQGWHFIKTPCIMEIWRRPNDPR